ncbi:hypothetical protein HPB49_025421 [Dermacentor silvarum]|uniref:Uncharacterized protein n=1 Tax=Dermacentor silvarum TaxID=543639 RepID=A0ACB8E4K6_DERSI|nr:hypothetical protein HPB49_025421 [Dermacentor silvarum]
MLFQSQHVLGHTWYLSADFQLFAVSLLTLTLMRRRKTLVIGAFALLSLFGYAIGAWALVSSDALPFMVFPGQTPQITIETVHQYYILPFSHTVSYFSGCMTFLIMEDFRDRKITKVTMLFSVLDWSFILSYLLYLACEAPTAVLDKLVFSRLTGRGKAQKQKPPNEVKGGSMGLEKKMEDMIFSRC